MAQLNTNMNERGMNSRKRRSIKHSTHIDMTPMVDLMSLLITFFMLTTAFSKSKIMEIILPEPPEPVGTNSFSPGPRTLNLVLSGGNRIYYYIGVPPENESDMLASASKLQKLDFSKDGLRKTLLNLNILLFEKIDSLNSAYLAGEMKITNDSLSNIVRDFKKKDRKGPIVMIKADKTAKYRNIVDVIDEMQICNIARYAIVDPNEFELKLINNAPF
jgi:biopolymer transport protein ExbD